MEIILQKKTRRRSNFIEDALLELVSLFNSRSSYKTRTPSHPLRRENYALPDDDDDDDDPMKDPYI
jgi:hypothetical protein